MNKSQSSPPLRNSNSPILSPDELNQGGFDSNSWIKLKSLQFFSLIESFKINGGSLSSTSTILVIDKQLSGPFSLLFSMKQLNENGIQKLIYFEDLIINTPSQQQQQQQQQINSSITPITPIIFFCRTRLELVQKISQFIKLKFTQPNTPSQQQQQHQNKYYLISVPNLDAASNYLLESEGLLDFLKIESFDLSFIPYENDFLSLELQDFYSNCFIENDNYQLGNISKSLIKFQQLYGPFKNIIGKGFKSKKLFEMMDENQSLIPLPPSGEISKLKTLIIIDRTIDMIPLLLTQQTYQGLIDEQFQISSSLQIQLDKDEEIEEIFQNDQTKQQERRITIKKNKIKINLYNDLFFQQIKDLSFQTIPSLLHSNSLNVSKDYSDIKTTHNNNNNTNNNFSLPDIKRLLSKIPDLAKRQKSLETHVFICEELMKLVNDQYGEFSNRLEIESSIIQCLLQSHQLNNSSQEQQQILDSIENQLIKKKPLFLILRLLSLYCLTIGLSFKSYSSIIKDIIHVHGIESITTIMRMEKANLLGIKDNLKFKLSNQILKNFKLIFENNNNNNNNSSDNNNNNNNDIFSGYVPLITKLVEEIQKTLNNNKSNNNNYSILESKLQSINQPFIYKNYDNDLSSSSSSSSSSSNYNHNSYTMILFLGGVSYSEISSLRMLKKKFGRGNFDFVFSTTNIINGNTFLNNL